MQNIKKRTFWLLAIIGLLFVFTGCSKSNGNDFGEMKISFANSSYEYVVGETFTLNPSIQNGTTEDSELEWIIFDESVVKLVNGEFVALKEGKTIIKVASVTKPEVNAMVSVNVVKNQYFPVVTFNNVADKMNVDETQMIMTTIEGADFEANVTYRSLDNNVASVNELGVVEAFNAGATVIIVRIEEVGNKDNYEEYPFLIQVIEPEYLIEYELNGGKNHLENLDFYTKRQCPVELKEPTREGYDFLGWYDKDDNLVTEITKYEESDVKLYAKWDIIEYSANFVLVDFVIENSYSDGRNAIIISNYDKVKDWWSFVGVNKTDTDNLFVINEIGYKHPSISYSGPKNSDYYILIHGDYRNQNDEKYDNYYRLNSIVNDTNSIGKYFYIDMSTTTNIGAAIYEKMDTYTINENIDPFVTPVRVGHDFLGWYSVDENGVESAEPVTSIERGTKGDLTFISKWAPSEYAVTYNLNGGEGVAKDYYTFVYSDGNGEAYSLQTPTRDGYKFIGWYENAEFSESSVTEIAKGTIGEKEYFAKWELIPYTISYELNGGTVLGENATTYNVETPTFSLFECEKEHYNFLGWEDQDGNVYTDIRQGTFGNLELTAKYEAHTYNVIYNLNGGTGEEEATYSYSETDSYVLQIPEKAGYTFVGWYEIEDLSGTAVTEIPALSYDAKEYYAKWEIIEYTITYNLDGGYLQYVENVYDSRDDMILDFVSDLNSVASKVTGSPVNVSVPKATDVFSTSCDFYTKLNDYISAFYKKGLPNDEVLWAKWKWLYQYISDRNYEATGTHLLKDENGNVSSPGNFTTTVYHYIICGEVRNSWPSNKVDWTNECGIPLNFVLNEKYTVIDEMSLVPIQKAGYSFLGWYDSEDNKVEKIEKGSTGNLELTAKWEIIEYSIEYNLNEGVMTKIYTSREEVVADLLADYNSYRGKNHTAETMAALPAFTGGEISDASLFLYKYIDKYGWLVDYIASVAGSANKKAWEVFKNYTSQSGLNAANSNYIYSIAYELRAFIGGIKYTKNSNFHTADYSQESIGNGFWSYIPASSYTIESEDIKLLEPTRIDYKFIGWYDNVEFKGDPIKNIPTGSTGDLTLYAKWESLYKNIEYQLNGGEWKIVDLSSANPVQTFTLTQYLGYTSDGSIASLHNKKPAIYWYYIALVETAQTGVYEIKQIVYQNSNVTVDYDYVIMWYADGSDSCISTLKSIYNSRTNYIGDYVVFENLPNASTTNANINVKVYNSSDVTKYDEPAFKYKEGVGVTLVEPVKDGATFAGWYDNESLTGTKITKISTEQLGNIKLYAKWETNPFKVTLNTDGGVFTTVLDNPTLDDFAEKIVKDFNNTGDSEATNTTERENFKGTSHPNIKFVWNNSEKLDEYKWFFEFALAEIKAAAAANNYTNNSYYTSTVEMLERMIAGDTTAIGANYADARTLFRFWIEGLINSKLPAAADIYAKCMVDYSNEENMNRFLKVYQSLTCERTMFGSDELPIPTKAGYIFVGWYNENNELVTELTSDCVLTAKYEEAKVLIGSVGYATISDAIDAAIPGDTIVLKAGTYSEAITINKAISIIGPDAELVLSHDSSYSIDATKSAILSGAITISSSVKNVKLDGLVIKNSITLNSNENVTIENTVLNYNGSIEGNIAIPSGTTSKNLVVNNVYLYGKSCARTVYVKGTLENLTVTNCATLDGYSGLYDFVRFSAATEATAKGTITFSNNYVANTAEAAFMDRAPKTAKYIIENNYLVNIPAPIYFRSYDSVSTAQYSIRYNTFIECGDNAADWDVIAVTTGSSTVANVNYNVFIDCLTTAGAKTDYIIKIRTNAGTIDCSNNYSNNNFVDSANKTLLLNAKKYSALDVSGTKYTTETYEDYTVCVIDGKVYVYGLNLFNEE